MDRETVTAKKRLKIQSTMTEALRIGENVDHHFPFKNTCVYIYILISKVRNIHRGKFRTQR
jgi:hypothetical protein